MAELKTKPTEKNVSKFLDAIKDETKHKDAYVILDLLKKITKLEPIMWGPTMIGFGSYHYKYASGHEGDSFIIGFSPRKEHHVVYLMPGVKNFPDLLKKLGKFKTGGACLYIKKLEDIDITVLKQLLTAAYKTMLKTYIKKNKP